MPLFSSKKQSSSSRNFGLASPKQKLVPTLKKEKILEIELVAANFKFGKGTCAGGWYRPFVQLTNGAGVVVGRSQIVSCATDAQWPMMRLAYKPFLLNNSTTTGTTATTSTGTMTTTTTSVGNGSARTINSGTANSTSTRSMHSETSLSMDDSVLTQPLLLVVYDYKEDGNHLVLGRFKTSLQALLDRARELEASSKDDMKELRRQTPSYSLKSTDAFSRLYVRHMALSARGTPDPLSATSFAPQLDDEQAKKSKKKKNKIMFPDLDQVPPPTGLMAGLGRRQQLSGTDISKLSASDVDETEDTTLNDSHGDFLEFGLGSESDEEKDDDEQEETTRDVPVVDKDSLRRENARAMIAQAQARIEKRKQAKMKKRNKLMAKNLERACVRFSTEGEVFDKDKDDDNNYKTEEQLEIEHQRQLEFGKAMRVNEAASIFKNSVQKPKPNEEAVLKPTPAPVLASGSPKESHRFT